MVASTINFMSGDHSDHPHHQHAAPDAGGARLVQCVKLQEELPGLDAPPWPGPIGQRIFDTVSARAWALWEERQKMILNEYRLMPWQKEGQELILKHMEEFFFSESAPMPPGYVPPRSK